MSHLIILSGPSGVGKNTLIDIVQKEIEEIDYFKKVTTRDRREDDRDAEAIFLTADEYTRMMDKKKIALPYDLRGKKYGIPTTSFSNLKEQPLICALSDFDLIRALKEGFDTTTVYVKAPQKDIIDRLNRRQDTPEQRRKSIESIAQHLADFGENRDLFDYVIENGSDLKKAAQKLKAIVDDATKDQAHSYSFLIPRIGSSLSNASSETQTETRLCEGNTFTLLPSYHEMIKELKSLFPNRLISGPICARNIVYMEDNVNIIFESKRDYERSHISFGKIKLCGKKKDIAKVCAKIEARWPEIVQGFYARNKYVDNFTIDDPNPAEFTLETARYGKTHNYSLLTEEQRRFLIHTGIKDSKDSGGFYHAGIKSIEREGDSFVVTIHDSASYLWNKSNPGRRGHASKRIGAYRWASGSEEQNISDARIPTYEFLLKDDTKIRVEFDVYRDFA